MAGPASDISAPTLFDDLGPLDEPPARLAAEPAGPSVVVAQFVAVAEQEPPPSDQAVETNPVANYPDPAPSEPSLSGFSPIPRKRPPGATPWSTSKGPKTLDPELPPIELELPASSPKSEAPKLKLGVRPAAPQSQLSLDSTPRGRFEGESPNVFDGEDLDLPPFLRKKK